jgi:ABC-type multidrug transport system ATPase subunit
MTVREHLEFYAKVKGVLTHIRERIIERQLDEMDLRDY